MRLPVTQPGNHPGCLHFLIALNTDCKSGQPPLCLHRNKSQFVFTEEMVGRHSEVLLDLLQHLLEGVSFRHLERRKRPFLRVCRTQGSRHEKRHIEWAGRSRMFQSQTTRITSSYQHLQQRAASLADWTCRTQAKQTRPLEIYVSAPAPREVAWCPTPVGGRRNLNAPAAKLNTGGKSSTMFPLGRPIKLPT